MRSTPLLSSAVENLTAVLQGSNALAWREAAATCGPEAGNATITLRVEALGGARLLELRLVFHQNDGAILRGPWPASRRHELRPVPA